MVPMFAKLHLIKEGEDTLLRVIVKAQSYRLLPGMKYSGRWHVEGQTENIVAVGVYYCHVGEELEGGNLKFRAPEVKNLSSFLASLFTYVVLCFRLLKTGTTSRQITKQKLKKEGQSSSPTFCLIDSDRYETEVLKNSDELFSTSSSLIQMNPSTQPSPFLPSTLWFTDWLHS